MSGYVYSHESAPDFRRRSSLATEGERLALDLKERITRLNDQARIFIPLIALWVIVSIPVWSKSPIRFLLLFLNPFVLFPVGFCLVHLAVSLRGIARAKNRVREWEHITSEIGEID